VVAILGVILVAPPAARAAETYYISSSAGNDAYDGLAGKADGSHGPWKTLARASTLTCAPGDKLLLRCGDTWNEELTLKGGGTRQEPVTIATYGAGDRPYIRRELGKNQVCITVDNAAGLRFRGLELGYALTGIHVVTKPGGPQVYDYYSFEDCFFHDIANKTLLPKGGPWGWAISWDGPGLHDGVRVVHCIGLRTQGFFSGDDQKGTVVFDGDTISHGDLNQVYQVRARRFDILNNVYAYNYPWLFDQWGTTQVITGILDGGPGVRYVVANNEFGWPGDYPGSPDGCGYDFEVNTNDVTFRDNFVHNSYGEAVLFMGDRIQNRLIFDHNLFRNNVRFSPRWTSTISLPPSVTGSGSFTRNVFYLWPGKHAFGTMGEKTQAARPKDFTYANNDDHPTKPFAEMPLVSHIVYRKGARIYTFACKTPGATIRYTLDASLPNASSPVYRGPVAIRRSGVLNAKAFKPGFYPSYVNSLAIELRVPAVAAPVAKWPAGTAGAKPAATTARRLASLAGTFTLSFWARPDAVRAATPETGTGLGQSVEASWKQRGIGGNGMAMAETPGSIRGRLIAGARTTSRFGSGLGFSGEGHSISFHDEGLSSASDNFTISFWAAPEAGRATTPETTTGISGISGQAYALGPIQYSGPSGEAGAGVSVGTNGVSVFELADNYLPSPLVCDHPLSGWNHVVVVYRDRQPSLYLNGELAKTGVQSGKRVHPDFNLGGTGYGWYQGRLDDLRVYKRALTGAEIHTLYAGGQAKPVAWTLDKFGGTKGLPFALAPTRRGGGSGAGDAGVGVAVGTTGISVVESSDDYLPSVLVDTLPVKGWNHVAVVYEGGQPALYLNGIFEKTGCRSKKAVHPVFKLRGGGGLGVFTGGLEDVRVYDRALTDAEVQEIAAGGARR
jgi:hypothetical protein